MSIDELLQECAKSSQSGAWAEFIRRFHRLIASVVIRCCREWSQRSPELVEDLIQETYLKLCANNHSILANFRSEHPNSFLGYLKVVTANLACDRLRSLVPKNEQTVPLDDANNQAQTGTGQVEKMEDQAFFKKVDGILLARGSGSLEQKERAIFWLWYQQGFTAKEIASLPGIDLTPKGVESVIYRITKLIKRILIEDRGENRGKGFPAP
ncbi:MAG TPA: sigma-70 family RNA polymerase sigma factor [Candidatus Angelobacter sp.]|nr:sigma-70 family RNA polymerase sigma factor [Candidatus Angelobacter sp.]